MTEDDRVKSINEKSVNLLQVWLRKLDEEEVDFDDMVAELYALMIVAQLMGFRPDIMVQDAGAAADKLAKLLEETEAVDMTDESI